MASVDEIPAAATLDTANHVADEKATLGVRRFFTIAGRDPFEEVEWEIRDAFIPGKDKPVFEQKDVEFPKFWSQTATNIVAQKYFRGRMSSPDRERSVKQMIGRVVATVGTWGRDGGYFASDEEAETFEAELKALLVNQYVAFNSPVWFNVGFEEKPQCSACQPYHALVSTPEGMVPIGELVTDAAVGREVFDAQWRDADRCCGQTTAASRSTASPSATASSSRPHPITSSRLCGNDGRRRNGSASTSSRSGCGCTCTRTARRSRPRHSSPWEPARAFRRRLSRSWMGSSASRPPKLPSPAGYRPTASSASTTTARIAR